MPLLASRLPIATATLAATLAATGCVELDDTPPALVGDDLPDISPSFLGCNDGVAQIGELCLAPPTTIRATNGRLKTVLAVDLDADGNRDLVGVDDTRIYVVRGVAGGFSTWSFYQPPGGPLLHDIAAADLDGDGDLDLVTTDTANDRLIVRHQTGATNFAPALFFPTADGPTRILAARMNGDNRDDLVVLDDNADTIQVFLAGMLGAPASYGVGDTDDIAIGDCDATGSIDVMYFNGSGTATTLLARRNNLGVLLPPVGSLFPFGQSATEPLPSAPLAIVGGRMNADVFADVVVSAEWSRMATGRSNGNCTFTKLAEVHSYAWAYRLRLGDHDGNGTLDVAAPHRTDPAFDELSVVFGIGNGNLDPAYGLLQSPTGTVYEDAAFGDFNGDGARDLITASQPGFLLHRGTP